MFLRKSLAAAVAVVTFGLVAQAQAGEITVFPGTNTAIVSVEVQQGPMGSVVSAYKEGVCRKTKRGVQCRLGKNTFFAPQPSPLGQIANLFGGLGNFAGGFGNLAAGMRHLPDSNITVDNGSASASFSQSQAVSNTHVRVH